MIRVLFGSLTVFIFSLPAFADPSLPVVGFCRVYQGDRGVDRYPTTLNRTFPRFYSVDKTSDDGSILIENGAITSAVIRFGMFDANNGITLMIRRGNDVLALASQAQVTAPLNAPMQVSANGMSIVCGPSVR